MKWFVTRAARLILVGVLGLAALGCARRENRVPSRQDGAVATLASHRERADRPAAALAFSPPLLQEAPAIELSRDLRRPAAFVGYPESVAEFFYVRWDDRQSGGDGRGFGSRGGGSGSRDRYERRAISEKSGVLYR